MMLSSQSFELLNPLPTFDKSPTLWGKGPLQKWVPQACFLSFLCSQITKLVLLIKCTQSRLWIGSWWHERAAIAQNALQIAASTLGGVNTQIPVLTAPWCPLTAARASL
jgi:hypothetical protein